MEHKFIYYKLSSLHGTIMHFYHFFYGVFIPIILEYTEQSKKYKNLTFIISNDLGPMLVRLLELPIDIKLKQYLTNYNELKVEEKYLSPMDIHPTSNSRDMELLKKNWAQELTLDKYMEINKYMNDCVRIDNVLLNKNIFYDIVIIERKANKSFGSIYYKKDYTPLYGNKITSSGSERRSIVNHEEIVKFIKRTYPKKKIINVSLEFMPIFSQYQLIHNASMVIAQHGAGLGLIVFMKPTAKIIEIVSMEKIETGENWFPPISKVCGIDHYQYVTKREHALIKFERFKKFLTLNNLLL